MANRFVTIQDYSKALEELITKVFKGGSVVYGPIQLVWEQYQKQKDGKITLPFISFFPSTEYTLDLENTSQPDYQLGNLPRFKDDKNLMRDQSIKVNINYYFEIVAQERATAEQLLTELIFWFQRNQQVSLTRDEERFDFTFLVDPTITDNSNYDNYHEEGMIYRFTIPIGTEIYLFRSKLYRKAEKAIIDIKEVNDNVNY